VDVGAMHRALYALALGTSAIWFLCENISTHDLARTVTHDDWQAFAAGAVGQPERPCHDVPDVETPRQPAVA
jgi:hypothetical protein